MSPADFPVQEVTQPHNSVRIYPSQPDSVRHVGATETGESPCTTKVLV